MGISLELIYPDSEVYNEAGEKIKSEAVGKEWRKKNRGRENRRFETTTGKGSFLKNSGQMKS